MNVLLTNPNYKHTWALASYLHKEGHNVFCVSKKKFSLLTASRFIKKLILIKNISESECLPLIDKYSIDMIVPVGFLETLSFSKLIKNSKFRNIITVTNHEDILFASSKKPISEHIQNLGILIPKTYDIDSILFRRNKTFLDKSFFIKPSKEGLIKKYYEVKNTVDFDNACNFFSGIGYSNDDLIIQEFIDGVGVGYFAVCDHGAPLVEYAHMRVREWPKSGGYSTACKIYHDEELNIISRNIIKSLNWRGPIMIEFRKSKKNHKYYFIEINPKFWGSLELGLQGGVNIVDALKKIINPNHRMNRTNIQKNITIAWPLDGDGFHYLKNPKLLSIFFDKKWIISTGLISDPLYGLLKILYFPIRFFKEYIL